VIPARALLLLFFPFAWAGGCRADETPLLRDFIGLNGHTVQFKPDLYQPIGKLVRDYHPVEWDLGPDSSKLPPFPFAKNGVDWSKVYGSWRSRGWTTDVCLMFESLPQKNWRNLEADAKAYGRAFAAAFGPSGSRRLVDSVEIGNEPGSWKDADYRKIFSALAEGIREGDPKLTIATCNLCTGPSGSYEKSVNCLADHPELYDVLNIHSYAQIENWPTWRRSYPEDPGLKKYLPDIEALCRWRDTNATGKPVWLTEFGYDSSTRQAPATGDFSKWVGVTDLQQAQWLVRSLLVFSTLPVQRAYIYFFNDEDKPMLHSSSGLTRHFQPKPSYWAVAHLQKTLGDFRFNRMVTQEGQLRVQEYKNGQGQIAWAVWSPTGKGLSSHPTLSQTPGKLVRAEPMLLQKNDDATTDATQDALGDISLTVSESPLYLFFEKN